jgi:hypothetical protein
VKSDLVIPAQYQWRKWPALLPTVLPPDAENIVPGAVEEIEAGNFL